MGIAEFLTEVGVHVTAEIVSNVGKAIANTFRNTNNNPSKEQLKASISSALNIKDANVFAERLVNIMASKGVISIQGSHIHSNTAIELFSANNGSFIIADNSITSTPNTRIEIGKGASVQGSGGAGIRQNEDGSIDFFV